MDEPGLAQFCRTKELSKSSSYHYLDWHSQRDIVQYTGTVAPRAHKQDKVVRVLGPTVAGLDFSEVICTE